MDEMLLKAYWYIDKQMDIWVVATRLGFKRILFLTLFTLAIVYEVKCRRR